MAFGPQGPSVYAFEALAEWANKKYNAGFDAEYLQNTKPQKIHDRLIELSEQYNTGKLEEGIDEKIAALNSQELIEWANERFDAEIAEDDLSPDQLREKIIVSGRQLLRRELGDLEKYVLIQIYDGAWKDHLYAMDHLKESIFLRAFAEKDPKMTPAYKADRVRSIYKGFYDWAGKVMPFWVGARSVSPIRSPQNG